MKSLARLLEHLAGEAGPRALFGTVTGASGDTVTITLDGSEVELGPMWVVTGKLKVGDRAMVTWLPDNKCHVAWGFPVAAGDLTLVFQYRVGAGDDRIRYLRRTSGTWDAVPTEALAGGAFPSAAIEEDAGGLAEPSVVSATTDHNGLHLDQYPKPHIRRMSDGALVAVTHESSNVKAFVRDPSTGNWSSTVIDADSMDHGCGANGPGDVFYFAEVGSGGFRLILHRIAYAAGAVSVTSVTVGPADFRDPAGLYYDPVNDLLHLWHFEAFDNNTGILSARDPVTLAEVYQATGVHGRPPNNNMGEGSDMDGDGAGNLLLASYSTTGSTLGGLGYRVAPGPSSYSVTVESIPDRPTTVYRFSTRWDGETFNLFYNQLNGSLRTTRRTSPDNWEAWTTLVATNIVNAHSVARWSGGAVRFLWMSAQSAPNNQIRESTV